MGSGSSKSEPAPVNKSNNCGGKDDAVPLSSTDRKKQYPPAETKIEANEKYTDVKDERTTSGKTEDATIQQPKTATEVEEKAETQNEQTKAEEQKSEKKEMPPSPVKKEVKETDHGKPKKAELEMGTKVEDKLIDEGPKEQLKFDCALKSACLLVLLHLLTVT